MCPRSHNQTDRPLLGLRESDVIQVRGLRAPGVIPAAHEVDGDVLVLRHVGRHVRAAVLPEIVVVAVTHGFDEPGLVVRRELERRHAAPERQALRVFADLLAEPHEGLADARVARRMRALRQAEVEDPVQPAQLEGAVVPDAVPAVVRHGVHRNHGLEIRWVREGQRVLRAAGVRRPDRADAAVRPRLLADPLRGVEPVVPVVAMGPPASLGIEAPAHVLGNGNVSMRDKISCPTGRFAVRSALEDGWKLPRRRDAVDRRPVDVGG